MHKLTASRGRRRAALLLFLALWLFLPALGGCGGGAAELSLDDAGYTIRIEGYEGQPFTGSYMVMEADGHIVTTEIEGQAPREYRVKGLQVDLNLQKPTQMGYLEVTILRGGTQVAYGDITASYGSIWLTGR